MGILAEICYVFYEGLDKTCGFSCYMFLFSCRFSCGFF
jgi:hypothetical protein